MKGRRVFLKSILGLLIAAPAGGLLGPSRAAALDTTGLRSGGLAGLAARRHGAFFLVDGWVLTARDMEALGRDDL